MTGEEPISAKEHKTRVLVVDDDNKILRFMRTSLRLSGYEPLTATDGEEGLQLAKSQDPDIMLLDILMPGTDGFNVLRRLRTFSDMPVIAISADPSYADKAIELGANCSVAKPFRPEECIGRISSLLKR